MNAAGDGTYRGTGRRIQNVNRRVVCGALPFSADKYLFTFIHSAQ